MKLACMSLLAVLFVAVSAPPDGVTQEPTPTPPAPTGESPQEASGKVVAEPVAPVKETTPANAGGTTASTKPPANAAARDGSDRVNSPHTDATPHGAELETTPELNASPPSELTPGGQQVSQQAYGPMSKLQESLDRLRLLVLLAIVVTLVCTLVLLRRLSRRNTEVDQSDRGDEEPPHREELSIPQLTDKMESPSKETAADPSEPSVSESESVTVRAPVDEKPQPAQPLPPDEFTSLPHGAVGRVLSQLLQALPELARRLSDPRQQERFLNDLNEPLKARIDRFKAAARKGDDYLKEHWIEQDLVTTLNTLAQLLSSVIKERHRGRRGNRLLEEDLLRWLYERLAPALREEGWFSIEPILPFTTKFDPKIHYSVGSEALEGADNLIVEIKAIGRRDLQRKYVTHRAEVIVGR